MECKTLLDRKSCDDNDSVAEYSNGTKKWYRNGVLHRDDGPAIEQPDGTKEWYRNGKLHCDDGPAIEYPDGTRFWYQNGKFHREDGPAVEYANGTKKWYLNNTDLTKADFASIEMINKMQAWELFEPKELAEMRLASNVT